MGHETLKNAIKVFNFQVGHNQLVKTFAPLGTVDGKSQIKILHPSPAPIAVEILPIVFSSGDCNEKRETEAS
jgi:hypothetical protein